jgi:CheY-like chemotaxis protein
MISKEDCSRHDLALQRFRPALVPPLRVPCVHICLCGHIPTHVDPSKQVADSIMCAAATRRCLPDGDPLIAMDLAQAFERAGARVITTRSLREALRVVESEGLSAAILDHALGDGDSSQLCARLKERNIPFTLYTGYSQIVGVCRDAPIVPKPAQPSELVDTIAGLLRGRSIPN